MFKKTIAKRKNVKLMIGLAGVAGSGKTYSALQMAYGITGDWGKIALADTENSSALYYAGKLTGDWQHIPFNPDIPNGYHPNNWQDLIGFVEQDSNIDVLILDSISHEWEGAGGCLDIIDKINKGFTGWRQVTPLHTSFIDTMRNSRLHIIATMRKKSDYVVEQNKTGKVVPRKIGLKANQRDGTDYEFGVIYDIDISHYATVSKDRTGVFANKGMFKISDKTGRDLLNWANEMPIEDLTLYTESIEQKKALAVIAKKHGIINKNELIELSSECKGKPIEDLEKNISAYLQLFTTKPTPEKS